MKKDKNKDRRSRSQKAGDQPIQNTPGKSGQRNEEKFSSVGGSLTSGVKKPISHKTGDATNFGERSYRED